MKLPFDEQYKQEVCELSLKGLPRDAIYKLAQSRGVQGTDMTLNKFVYLLEKETAGNPLRICTFLDMQLPEIQEVEE